jgi:hypothetical protein
MTTPGTAEARSRQAFTQVPNWISTSRRISADAKRLLAALIHDNWAKTQPAYRPPGTAALALWIGSNRANAAGEFVACKQTVLDAIAELERLELLTVIRRERTKSRYLLDVAALEAGEVDLVTGGDQNAEVWNLGVRDDLVISGDQFDGLSGYRPLPDCPNLVTGGDRVKTTVRPPLKDSNPASPNFVSLGGSDGEAGRSTSAAGHEADETLGLSADSTSPSEEQDEPHWSPPVTRCESQPYDYLIESILFFDPAARTAGEILSKYHGAKATYEMLRDAGDDAEGAAIREAALLTVAGKDVG